MEKILFRFSLLCWIISFFYNIIYLVTNNLPLVKPLFILFHFVAVILPVIAIFLSSKHPKIIQEKFDYHEGIPLTPFIKNLPITLITLLVCSLVLCVSNFQKMTIAAKEHYHLIGLWLVSFSFSMTLFFQLNKWKKDKEQMD